MVPDWIPAWPAPPLLATLVFAVSVLLAASLRWFLQTTLRIDWIARTLNRSGLLAGFAEPSLDEAKMMAAGAGFWIVVLAGFATALSILNASAAAWLVKTSEVHLPKILLASFVLGTSHWLGGYWRRATLLAATNEGLPYPWRWAALVYAGTIFTGIALVSELTEVATSLIRSAYLIVLAGAVLLCVLALAPALKSHLADGESRPRQRVDDTFR